MKNRIESLLAIPTALAERDGQIEHLFSTEVLKDQLQKAGITVERAIVARPGTSLVVAAAAGMVLGWLLKRK